MSTPAALRPPERLWGRDFTLCALTNLFVFVVFYLLITAMALYAVNEFRASDAMAGLAASGFVLGSVAARLVAGQAMEFISPRRMLLVSMALFLAFSALYLVAGSLVLLIIVRVLHGVSFGVATTVLATAVQGLIPPHRRSEGTGWFSTSNTVASAIGPLLAFQLTDRWGFGALFLACTAVSVLGVAAALLVRVPAVPRAGGERPRFTLLGLISRPALPVSVVILLAGLAYSSVLAFLNSHAHDQGIDPTSASLFFVVYAAVLLASRFVVGPLHDRHGDNAVALPLLIFFMGGLAVLGLWPTVPGLMVAGALCAIGFGALLSCLQSVAAAVVSPAQIGVATSTYFLMLDVGIGIGPVLLGLLLPVTGFSGMYLGLAGFVLAIMAVYWLTHGRHRQQRAGG